MKRQITLYFIFLFTLTASAQDLLEKTITVEGLEREYLLYVPAAYDGSEDWPLMFNLHGAGSNPEEQLFFSGMNAVADTGHFLVAYPLGIQNADGFEGTGWNARLLPDFQDDVLFINNLIDTIAGEYSVDLARVYACGMSNGGGMSYTLSCTLPGRFAAIATVASPGVLEDCDPQRPFPYLYIHGTEDTFAPFNGGQSTSLPQLDIEFPAAYEHLQSLLERNGCTLDSTVIEFDNLVTEDNSTISVRKFTNCNTYLGENGVEQSAEVWFYVIENGGHVWPGVSLPPFFGNSNLDINASIKIWNFFSRHSLHQPQLLEKTITVDGLEREYLLYVPAAYDGSEKWPLVLNLHGYLWDGEAQIWISEMNPVADTDKFLIAYPTGQMIDLSGIENAPPFIPDQGVGWNLGGNLSEYDDITFLEEMIDEIISEYQVDENRVYSTGLSMGGITSYMLACSLPDRIAAVAPVAASMLPEEGSLGFPCVPISPVPVFQIHGTNDIVDPFEDPWATIGALNSIGFWVSQNGCDSSPMTTELEDTDTTDESTVTSIKYQECDEGSEVWLYRVNDGGHWWPGGGALPSGGQWQALGPVNRDINASAEIWNFFNRHTLTNTSEYPKPSEINLQTYPNPAASQLTFEFELPEAARVNITLYNPLGQPVQVMAGKQLPAGQQQISWQLPDAVAAGLYHCRLQIGERVVSKAVVLGR